MELINSTAYIFFHTFLSFFLFFWSCVPSKEGDNVVVLYIRTGELTIVLVPDEEHHT